MGSPLLTSALNYIVEQEDGPLRLPKQTNRQRDRTQRSKIHCLFDHLVGAAGQGQRDGNTKRLGDPEIQE
jgi:hypothetical protein